jgi:hypothetical protein
MLPLLLFWKAIGRIELQIGGAKYLPPEIEEGLRAKNIPPLQKNVKTVTFVTF